MAKRVFEKGWFGATTLSFRTYLLEVKEGLKAEQEEY